MASTNKTPKLGLNQWAAGDPVLREDFNADNLKIDALVGQSACMVGSFVGDGRENRVIDLGIKPKFLMLFGLYDARYYTIAFIFGKNFYNVDTTGVTGVPSGAVDIAENGFQIIFPSYFNTAGKSAQYIAFY